MQCLPARAAERVSFAPVVLATGPVPDTRTEAASIEIVIGPATVRVPPGVDAAS
jgi:hypothetical protein